MDLEELADQLTPLIAQRLLVTASVYGEASRIKVAPDYCFNNTLFNTISGNITVEEDVCFGHNVCLGAWLASNVTVLGPCEIGENAVIAAGSLVLSDVKPNCVYAGTPAKFIKEIKFNDDL
jgi:acetyltransferase-like isoleucine patch superfamily enzyme